MNNLTELQKKALNIIKFRGKENPITGAKLVNKIKLKSRQSGYIGADMRSIIHSLRVKGYPICANTKGYFYANNKQELIKYMDGLSGRIEKTIEAHSGLAKSHDKVGVKKITEQGQLV